MKIQKGGLLPIINEMSKFEITNEAIERFSRYLMSPMDCVINALQLLQLITNETADIMRITSIGNTGIEKRQIELIFMYLKNHNFEFREMMIYEWEEIIHNLPDSDSGTTLFCGYSTGSDKHVFLISRNNANELAYIDPQSDSICNIYNEECLINNVIRMNRGNLNFRLYILYHSTELITDDNKAEIRDEINRSFVVGGDDRADRADDAMEIDGDDDRVGGGSKKKQERKRKNKKTKKKRGRPIHKTRNKKQETINGN